MEDLFEMIAKDFSGKVFTKEDLSKKYMENNTIKYDKILLQHKNDIENYIKTTKNKAKNQTL
tara:strand:+ start:1644 stop:1829 length:186 start_codon:yes stop_codon:yes gene_type:complete